MSTYWAFLTFRRSHRSQIWSYCHCVELPAEPGRRSSLANGGIDFYFEWISCRKERSMPMFGRLSTQSHRHNMTVIHFDYFIPCMNLMISYHIVPAGGLNKWASCQLASFSAAAWEEFFEQRIFGLARCPFHDHEQAEFEGSCVLPI